jgi:DNA-binding NtrC family response regulator
MDFGQYLAADLDSGAKFAMRILLVEDDFTQRALLMVMLKRDGYTVVEVADANDALSILRKDAGFDLMICDVRMPGMDGFGLLDSVKQSNPYLPVLMVSAHARPAWVTKAAERGAAGFLAKPFTREQLIAIVRNAINRSEAASA